VLSATIHTNVDTVEPWVVQTLVFKRFRFPQAPPQWRTAWGCWSTKGLLVAHTLRGGLPTMRVDYSCQSI